MNTKTQMVNALDGISKAFYMTADDETSTLALKINVQWSRVLSDPILDIVQDRLDKLYVEITEALQKEAQERSQ